MLDRLRRRTGRGSERGEGLVGRAHDALSEIRWGTPGAPRGSAALRRRRAVAAGGALAVVLLLVVGLTRLLGGGPDRDVHERAQLEAVAPGSSKRDPEAAVRVSPAVRRAAGSMSLPRQVAQLFVVDMAGRYPRDPFFGELRRRGWGGVVLGRANFVDQGQFTALTGELRVVAGRSGAALPLVAVNQSGGAASALADLPPRAQPSIGRSRRPALAASQALAAARALRRLGVNMNLAPVADVGTAAGPVQSQVFGDDPTLVSRMVRAAVDGYRRGRVVSAVGHFPGIGAASGDPAETDATVALSLPDLRRRDLLPFAAVARRVPVIVVTSAVYAAFDGVTPAVMLPEVIGVLLRGQLGFGGAVMTDDLNSAAPVVGVSLGETAVGAMLSGADLLYVSGGSREHDSAYRVVLAAVRSGRISRERLRLSVLRVLALKQRYGLLAARRSSRPPRR